MMEIQYPQGLCPVLPCPAHQAWHCQFSKDLSEYWGAAGTKHTDSWPLPDHLLKGGPCLVSCPLRDRKGKRFKGELGTRDSLVAKHQTSIAW